MASGLVTTDQLRGSQGADVSLASITTLTLTVAQSRRSVIKFTGNPGAGATVTIPIAEAPAGQEWTFWNACSGGFAVTVIAAGGTGITVANARVARGFSDGVNLNRCGADTVAT